MNPIGHSSQRKVLERLLRSSRLPASMMFAGPQGIGKHTIALELARSFFCLTEDAPYGGCGSCHNCHLFDVGNLPDLLRVDCADKEKWDLERVRELLYSLNLRSFSTKGRIVLFDNAESMPVQAANVLLKSVEEPGANTHFILVTSNPSKLPATLVSRCQRWFFDSLTDEEIQKVLARVYPSPETVGLTSTELVAMADGSLENVKDLGNSLELWKLLNSELPLIANADTETAIRLSSALSKEKDNFSRVFRLLRLIGRDNLHKAPDSERRRWAFFLTNAIDAERLILERNLSPQSVILAMLLSLAPSPSFTIPLERDNLLQNIVV